MYIGRVVQKNGVIAVRESEWIEVYFRPKPNKTKSIETGETIEKPIASHGE